MDISFGNLNWIAIATCVVIGQVFLTVWFAVIFGEQWARAYGAASKTQHTREVPGYTYAIGLLCMILLTVGIAALQKTVGATGFAAGIRIGLFVTVFYCIATALPGYAFLRRWNAFNLAIGSQAAVITIVSVVLAIWPK